MKIITKALQSIKAIKITPKALACGSALSILLPMSFLASEVRAQQTFYLESGVALNTNYSFRRINGQPRMSLWSHDVNDRDQQFIVRPDPDGGWQIQQASTGKCLNANHVWRGGEVNVWPCNYNDPDQNFDIIGDWGGPSLIRRSGTNLCLDVPVFRSSGRVHLWDCMPGNPHQRWFSHIVGSPNPRPWENVWRNH